MTGAIAILVCWPLVCFGMYRILAREANRASSDIRRCPRCGEVFRPGLANCPMCGFREARQAARSHD